VKARNYGALKQHAQSVELSFAACGSSMDGEPCINARAGALSLRMSLLKQWMRIGHDPASYSQKIQVRPPFPGLLRLRNPAYFSGSPGQIDRHWLQMTERETLLLVLAILLPLITYGIGIIRGRYFP